MIYALILLPFRNYFDVMWYLLEQYPKALYILDKYGRTSLHLAAKFGNERMVVSLARISPRSLFVKDVFGKTPVMVAEAEEQKNGISFEEENGNARALRIELSRFYLAAIDSPTDTFNSANSFDFVSSSGSDEPQQQQQKQHDQLTMEDVVAVVGDTSEIVKPKKSVTFSVKHNVREIRRVVDIAEDHKRRKQLRNKCTIL